MKNNTNCFILSKCFFHPRNFNIRFFLINRYFLQLQTLPFAPACHPSHMLFQSRWRVYLVPTSNYPVSMRHVYTVLPAAAAATKEPCQSRLEDGIQWKTSTGDDGGSEMEMSINEKFSHFHLRIWFRADCDLFRRTYSRIHISSGKVSGNLRMNFSCMHDEVLGMSSCVCMW